VLSRIFPSAVVLTAAVVLAGCTASIATPSPTDVAAPVVTPAAPSNEVLAEYFAAVASQDPTELRRVADEIAAPESNAYAYAIEQAGVSQAIQDAGYPLYEQKIKTIAGGFALCEVDTAEDAPCSEYTNLTYTDGKLADFDAGGEPLTGRISLGDGTAVPLGDLGTVTFIAAYRSIAGAVFVVVDIRSNIDGLSPSYSSSYIAPDGRQANAAEVTGPTELSAGALGTYFFAFDGAVFGGTLKISAFNANYDEVSADIATS
jgi:hypothetical protein